VLRSIFKNFALRRLSGPERTAESMELPAKVGALKQGKFAEEGFASFY
jgi:hypothetical protein